MPFQYKKVFPEEKMIDNNNPPQMKVEFFKEQKIENINCFSNEGAGWDNSKIVIKENILKIIFRDKFNSRRGRVNCSIKDIEGWRWFGIQFTGRYKRNQIRFLTASLFGNILTSSKSTSLFC